MELMTHFMAYDIFFHLSCRFLGILSRSQNNSGSSELFAVIRGNVDSTYLFNEAKVFVWLTEIVLS